MKSKNTSSGPLENIYGKFGDRPCSGSWEEVENVSANQSPMAAGKMQHFFRPSWISDRN